jgi:hypothetical protein
MSFFVARQGVDGWHKAGHDDKSEASSPDSQPGNFPRTALRFRWDDERR